MKKILLGFLIISTLLVQGCGNYRSKASRLEYLVFTDNLTSTNNKLSPEQKRKKIENDIARGTSMRGHDVTITPYTVPLIYARTEEKAYKNKWDQNLLQQAFNAEVEEYAQDKQHFLMTTTSWGGGINVNPEHIFGELVDSYGRKFPIQVINEIANSSRTSFVPDYTGYTYGTQVTVSHSALQFYVDTKVDFSKPVILNMDLRYESFLKPFTLEWKVKQ